MKKKFGITPFNTPAINALTLKRTNYMGVLDLTNWEGFEGQAPHFLGSLGFLLDHNQNPLYLTHLLGTPAEDDFLFQGDGYPHLERVFKGKVWHNFVGEFKKLIQNQNHAWSVDWDNINGSDWQKKVWQTIFKVKWGQTISYKALATKAGRERAYRSAANCCGQNPLMFLIPCHRIIASGGGLGGFGAPIELKHFLLKREVLETVC